MRALFNTPPISMPRPEVIWFESTSTRREPPVELMNSFAYGLELEDNGAVCTRLCRDGDMYESFWTCEIS